MIRAPIEASSKNEREEEGTEAKRRMPKKPRLPKMEYISGFTLVVERWLVPEEGAK